METITFDDFKKLNICIGTIVEAERVPDADKLLRLVFNCGDEKRQIIAGIAPFIDDPAGLIGKQMPVVVNLEPRTMRGFKSEGMLLAADNDGRPVLLHPDEEVPAGSPVR